MGRTIKYVTTAERLSAKAKQKRQARARESPERRKKTLKQMSQYFQAKIEKESREQRESRLKQRAQAARVRRSVETPKARSARLAQNAQRKKDVRDKETPEERRARVAARKRKNPVSTKTFARSSDMSGFTGKQVPAELQPPPKTMDRARDRGDLSPIPAWLEIQGLTEESLRAAVTGLGIEIFGALCARAEPASMRVQLCSFVTRKFNYPMYAELCRFMESCHAGRLGPTVGPIVRPAMGPTVETVLGPVVGLALGPVLGPAVGPVLRLALGPTVGPILGPTLMPALWPNSMPALGPTSMPALGPTSMPALGPTVETTLGLAVVPAGVLCIKIKEEDSFGSKGRDPEDGTCKSLVGNYSCTSCSCSFTSEADLQAHSERHRPDPDVQKDRLTNSSDTVHLEYVLTANAQTEAASKLLYTCNVCGKTFIYRSVYNRHIHRNKGLSTNVDCWKAFSQALVCQKCRRIHTGECPYSCKACSQAFWCEPSLKTHMRIHMGQRPYRCKICPQIFSSVLKLKRHMCIHMGEHRFVCEVCSFTFWYEKDFKRHIGFRGKQPPTTQTLLQRPRKYRTLLQKPS